MVARGKFILENYNKIIPFGKLFVHQGYNIVLYICMLYTHTAENAVIYLVGPFTCILCGYITWYAAISVHLCSQNYINRSMLYRHAARGFTRQVILFSYFSSYQLLLGSPVASLRRCLSWFYPCDSLNPFCTITLIF